LLAICRTLCPLKQRMFRYVVALYEALLGVNDILSLCEHWLSAQERTL